MVFFLFLVEFYHVVDTFIFSVIWFLGLFGSIFVGKKLPEVVVLLMLVYVLSLQSHCDVDSEGSVGGLRFEFRERF